MIYPGIQAAMAALGKAGCYFLSICKASGDACIDVIEEYRDSVASGALGADCYVQDPARIMAQLVGGSWEVIKAGPGHPLPLEYVCKAVEREILRYERPVAPGEEPAHFVLGDGNGHVVFDPWGDSATVRDGHLASKRILRRIK